jgi:hypothetical protein
MSVHFFLSVQHQNIPFENICNFYLPHLKSVTKNITLLVKKYMGGTFAFYTPPSCQVTPMLMIFCIYLIVIYTNLVSF